MGNWSNLGGLWERSIFNFLENMEMYLVKDNGYIAI